MRIAIYPGTFDPIHCGHMDIARRAAALFDRLILAVYSRPNKRLLFSTEERIRLTQEALCDIPNLEIRPYNGLTVTFARSVGATVLVRGLRVISDFELEYQMALTNRQLASELETICLMTRQEHAFLSSSIVKEVFLSGGDVAQMTAANVIEAMAQKREILNRTQEPVPLISLRD